MGFRHDWKATLLVLALFGGGAYIDHKHPLPVRVTLNRGLSYERAGNSTLGRPADNVRLIR
jgi:hypothetical protein